MVKTIKAVLVLCLATVVSAGVAMAQHNHAATSDQQGNTKAEDMMKSCQKHGSETMATLDKLEKTIAAGRESNDPAKMKAALDEAQTQLAEAKHHMSMCPMMGGGAMPGMQHMDHMKGMSNQQSGSHDHSNTPQ